MTRSPAERLERRATVDENGCWLVHPHSRGYGKVRVGAKTMLAHRAMYAEIVGPIPEGLNVCHSCDVRNCVNPEHLFLATQKENIADMIRKGRAPDRRNNVKLTPVAVQSAILMVKMGTPILRVAKMLGVSDGTIHHVLKGNTWKEVPR